jgi:hypothetical protein
MLNPRSLSTKDDVDEFIEMMLRNERDRSLLVRAQSRHWSAAERAAEARLDLMCTALERLRELEREIPPNCEGHAIA